MILLFCRSMALVPILDASVFIINGVECLFKRGKKISVEKSKIEKIES